MHLHVLYVLCKVNYILSLQQYSHVPKLKQNIGGDLQEAANSLNTTVDVGVACGGAH